MAREKVIRTMFFFLFLMNHLKSMINILSTFKMQLSSYSYLFFISSNSNGWMAS